MGLLSVRSKLALLFDRNEFDDSKILFDRASEATVVNADGFIETVGNNIPRLDYDPVTGELLGLLIEEQRTNLVRASELFNLEWTASQSSWIPNVVTAPNGKINASKLIENTASNIHQAQEAVTLSNSTTYVLSCYFKEGGRNAGLRLQDKDGSFISLAWFDLTTGTATNSSADAVGIEPVRDGWYRCWAVFTTSASGSTTSTVRVCTHNGSSFSYSGDGVSGIYVWGAQLEQGDFPTSYIPTIPTFTSRASTKYYQDSNGDHQLASVYEEVTEQYKRHNGQWVSAGLLLEESATNLFENSENLTSWQDANVSWSNSGTLLGITRVRVTNTGTGGISGSGLNYLREYIPVVASSQYCISFYAEAGTSECIGLRCEGSNSGKFNFTDKVASGILTSGFFDDVRVTEVGAGIFLFELVFTALDTSFEFRLGQCDNSNVSDGTQGADFFVAGFQCELGAYRTSYIPTSGSTVTRSVDVYAMATATRVKDTASIDGSAFSDFYNQSEGTFVIEAENNDLGAGSLFQRYLYLQGDDATNRLQIQRRGASDPNIQIYFEKGDVNSFKEITNATIDSFFKMAFAIMPDEDTVRYSVNGGDIQTVVQATEFTSRFNRLHIGHAGDTAQLQGRIKRIVYYPKAYDDATIQLLTKTLSL
jgi:hypothetical protein